MRPILDGVFDLTRLGAFASAPGPKGVTVSFGLWLPNISDGFLVEALVIHADDRFVEDVPSIAIELTHDSDDFWTGSYTIATQRGTSFGKKGRYLYRYRLSRVTTGKTTVLSNSVADPFATQTDDVGQFSAFETPGTTSGHRWTDDNWRVPCVEDLIVYELDVEEFNGTFDGVVDRLGYLQSLGVNCLELMPVTSLRVDFDWGYSPLNFFAPNERWGGAPGLKRLVNECHNREIAVILDVVYYS